MNKRVLKECLVVVEGLADEETYGKYIKTYAKSDEYEIIPGFKKEKVLDMNSWEFENKPLWDNLKHLKGSGTFNKILFIVDSDRDPDNSFWGYTRSTSLSYIDEKPIKQKMDDYWIIDKLKGASDITIYGITVPISGKGCLETMLLADYGFPIPGQKEYEALNGIIIKAGQMWGLTEDWYRETKNGKARMDKFIYYALTNGFKSIQQKLPAPKPPSALTTIMKVLDL
jgi:hypothetical protein